MTDNIKKLLELASADAELKAKLTNASKESIIATAKEAGIELTDADFELPDEELSTVSGGKGSDAAEKKIIENGLHTACIVSGGGFGCWFFGD